MNNKTKKEMRKVASGGGDDGTNMMTEYWDELKKKRGQGLTEGEAVLEFLKENEEQQKKERDRKAQANTTVWRRFFGRPV